MQFNFLRVFHTNLTCNCKQAHVPIGVQARKRLELISNTTWYASFVLYCHFHHEDELTYSTIATLQIFFFRKQSKASKASQATESIPTRQHIYSEPAFQRDPHQMPAPL